jgi:hypothetical protein
VRTCFLKESLQRDPNIASFAYSYAPPYLHRDWPEARAHPCISPPYNATLNTFPRKVVFIDTDCLMVRGTQCCLFFVRTLLASQCPAPNCALACYPLGQSPPLA